MSVQRTSFTRNLRGYLESSRLGRLTAIGRIARMTKSLSTEPVDPVDSLFAGIGDDYQSPDHLGGYRNITQQLLADDVLDSLIKLQSEIASFSDEMQVVSTAPQLGQDGKNARAMQAYMRAQDTHRPVSLKVFYDAG